MTVTGEQRDLFGRAARVVGDLDHEFYAEERQREVWNEASAVGMQAMLWGTAGLACAMTWLGGDEVVKWALALLAVGNVAAALMLGYANRQGVTGAESVRYLRPRTVLIAALYVATLVGVFVRGDVELDGPTLAGVVVGLAAGGGLAVAALVLARRRAAVGDDDGEDDPAGL